MKKVIISFLLVLSYVLAVGQNMPSYWVPTSGTNTYSTNITAWGNSGSYNNKIAFVRFTNANTGAATININGISAAPIRKWDGTGWVTLSAGDIVTDRDYRLSYDNTNGWFRLEIVPDAFGNGPLVMGVATNTDAPIAPIFGSTDGHVLRISSGSIGFGPIDLSDPDATTGTLSNYIPTSGSATLIGNVSISGAFNTNWGLSGSRMGNFRVWSNGTVGLDGATSSFLQSGNNTIAVDPTGSDINIPDGNLVVSTESGTSISSSDGTGSSFVFAQDAVFTPSVSFAVSTPTVEMNVDTDYRFYNTVNNNFATWGASGYSVNLDEFDGTGSFAVNDSDSPIMVIGALGDITFHSVPEYDVAPTLSNDLQLTHKLYVDSKAPLAMPSVTYTANRVAGTADIGKIVYMNVTTANTFTINSGVFPVGTFLNVRVLDEATTAVEGAGVTINAQSGSLVLNSSGINVFYQTSADVWELYNGSTFAYSDATLSGDINITTTSHTWTFTGGDFVATDGTNKIQVDAGSGLQFNVGSDATGDIYYRNSSGYLTRLPVGSNGQVLTLASGLPSWSAAGGISDGDKGDITVSASGATWTVDNSTITYAKMQNAAGGTRIIGRSAVSSGALNEIVATAAGQVLRRDGSGLGFGAVDLADTDAVTGVLPTGNGGSLSGTYTPTLTGVNNIDASTAYQCQYMRAGNVVTVSGQFDADVTLTATSSQLDISLPIASNFSAAYNCAGTSSGYGISVSGAVLGDASNDRATVTWTSATTSNNTYTFQFTYLVQ